MSYTPNDPSTQIPPYAMNGALWAAELANLDALYTDYAPPIVDNQTSFSSVTSAVTDTEVYQFKVRGNRDAQSVVVRVHVTCTGGNGTLTVKHGSSTQTAALTGAAAWYSVTLTSPGPDAVVRVSMICTTATGLAADGIVAYLSPSAPAIAPLASGFRRGYSVIDDANEPINTEHVQRLMLGPTHVAIDRPVCVVSALGPSNAAFTGKGLSYMVAYHTAFYDNMIRSRFPRGCDESSRVYTIDMLCRVAAVGPTYHVRIGAWEWEYQPTALSEWVSKTITLAPDEAEVQVSINTGATGAAQVNALQIWRGANGS